MLPPTVLASPLRGHLVISRCSFLDMMLNNFMLPSHGERCPFFQQIHPAMAANNTSTLATSSIIPKHSFISVINAYGKSNLPDVDEQANAYVQNQML